VAAAERLPVQLVGGQPMPGSKKPYNDDRAGPEDATTISLDLLDMARRILLNWDLESQTENMRSIIREEQLFNEDAYVYKELKDQEGTDELKILVGGSLSEILTTQDRARSDASE